MAPLRSSRLAGQFGLSFAAKPLSAQKSCERRWSRTAIGQGFLLPDFRPSVPKVPSSATRSTWWTQSSQIGQVLYHGRDGHATKPSWHGRLAREWLGGTRDLIPPRGTADSRR